MNLGIYYTVGTLGVLSVAVLLLLHFLLFETVRVYNWNGRRYVLVGRSRIRRGRPTIVWSRTENLFVRTATGAWSYARETPGCGFRWRNGCAMGSITAAGCDAVTKYAKK